jgi:hypothetical protein
LVTAQSISPMSGFSSVAPEAARLRKDQWLRVGEIPDVLATKTVEIRGLIVHCTNRALLTLLIAGLVNLNKILNGEMWLQL